MKPVWYTIAQLGNTWVASASGSAILSFENEEIGIATIKDATTSFIAATPSAASCSFDLDRTTRVKGSEFRDLLRPVHQEPIQIRGIAAGGAAMGKNDERSGLDRRSVHDRRSGVDTRSDEEKRLQGERRSSTDRRSATERRSKIVTDPSPIGDPRKF